MRQRIWEDAAAMSIVSVLGFLMNEEGEVVGAERTQVLCKLMPSIHTLSHRAILAMLVTGLNEADAQVFYAEGGLKILSAWIADGASRREPGMSKEKKRIEMFSQVRALLRILDVNVKTDATRKQNAFLTSTFPKAIHLLDNAGPDFAAEWSRLNIYRRHFEGSCGLPSSVKDGKSDVRRASNGQTSTSNGNTSTSTPGTGVRMNKSTTDAPARSSVAASSTTTASSASTSTSSSVRKASASTASSSSTSGSSHRISPSSVLQYQPKSFLQKEKETPGTQEDEDMDAYVEDEDEELLAGEGVITNVSQTALSASLEHKIKSHGHGMQYGERAPCRKCKRMAAKRCSHCAFCAKCAQKDTCEAVSVSASSPATSSPSEPGEAKPSKPKDKRLSVKDRNVQVLGSVMDQAIYVAFRQEDFHSTFSLIQNGMDVNFQRVESDNSSALMAAAHHGRDDAASKLLSLGANPSLEDKFGNKAWHFAERRGHTELMEKLKKRADEWDRTHQPVAVHAEEANQP